MISERAYDADDRIVLPREQRHFLLRWLFWLDRRLRPYLGWLALLVCMALGATPAAALSEADWLELGALHARLTLVAPAAVLLVWLLLGWRRPRGKPRSAFWRTIGALLVLLIGGFVVVTQILSGWIPGLRELISTTFTGAWPALGQQMGADLAGLFARFVRWTEGVSVGGATQDDLVFAGIAAVVFWVIGALTAWLTRRYRRGLVASIPSLWLLGTMLLYSSTGRGNMLTGLALAVALHLLLDQQNMLQRWHDRRYDYSPSIVYDRLFMVAGIGLFVLVVAAITPSLSIGAINTRYYKIIDPIYADLELAAERLFPDMSATSRRRLRGVMAGMPNEFLLSSGPDLGDAVVMRYRTNETAAFDIDFYEEEAPPGHYMRGLTLTRYDGKGWSNGPERQRTVHLADDTWIEPPERGRKLVTQSVFLEFSTSLLYAAPEPLQPSTDYRTEVRADGDLVALQASERSYTVVSAVPGANDEMLDAVGGWGADRSLPPGYEIHLDLPNTVTERTTELADDLTAGLDSQFQKAQAIETFLRGYEYDLTVSEPPSDVADVADYFLFDLQRGYCDYYATAFIVLARTAGIPARFATGFAVGAWNPAEGEWIVTEAEAHSWPEVYFPEYGWIPFEPTAGRPELTRIGVPDIGARSTVSVAAPVAPVEEDSFAWNWQMLFWLLPVALLLWGGSVLLRSYQARRQDPWQNLVRWGARIGRPMGLGETVLEYGSGLANFVVARQTSEQDTGRRVAHEVTALSDDVSTAQYGVEEQRRLAADRAEERWQTLRTYLRRIKAG